MRIVKRLARPHVMRMDSFVLVLVAALVFILAGFVKGVIGMGLPTIVVGLLSLVTSPAEAVALMLAPSMLTNVWQAWAGSSFKSIARRLWPAFLGICAGTWLPGVIGVGLLTPEAAQRGRVALGVTLAIYAALGLANIRFSLRAGVEPWLGPCVGLATGVLSAATGVFMIPAVPYYQAIGLSADEFVQAQGISYTISTFALAVLLMSGGLLQTGTMSMSMLAVAPALLGMAAGQYLRQAIRPDVFRLCFYIGMFALGAHLALLQR